MALSKAKFVIEQENKTIPVHFNPSEYKITASAQSGDGAWGIRSERLSFKLYFDTYTLGTGSLIGGTMNLTDREDVRMYTEPIAALSGWAEGKRPLVRFIWGSLNFKGVVTDVSQNFTMFMDDGKPVRAVLDVTMQQVTSPNTTKDSSTNWADGSWKSSVETKTGRVRDLLG